MVTPVDVTWPAVESAAIAANLVLGGRGEPIDRDAIARRYSEAIDARFGAGLPRWAERILDSVPRRIFEAAARSVCRIPILRRRAIFEGAFGMN